MPPKQDDLEPAGIDTSQQGVEISGKSMQSKVISPFKNNNNAGNSGNDNATYPSSSSLSSHGVPGVELPNVAPGGVPLLAQLGYLDTNLINQLSSAAASGIASQHIPLVPAGLQNIPQVHAPAPPAPVVPSQAQSSSSIIEQLQLAFGFAGSAEWSSSKSTANTTRNSRGSISLSPAIPANTS